MHPPRKLRESGASTPAKNGALLAENVAFHSPVLVRAVEGREQVAAVFAGRSPLRPRLKGPLELPPVEQPRSCATACRPRDPDPRWP